MIFLTVATGLVVLYTWAGYPVLLLGLKRLFGRSPSRQGENPTFSIIVACYNEQAGIAAKLEACLALTYPRDRLEIIVASDGSTDATEQIVEKFAARDARIRLLRGKGREGKSGVQNLAASQATGDILLFTDAETQTRPDLLEQIAEDFSDPQVGLVAPVVQFGRSDNSVSKGQGFYWRFEIFLRQLESDLGILATASGAAFAIRKNLYRPIPPEYGDDCIVPLDVCLQRLRILQDPRSIVFDEMTNSIDGELRSRIRMTARNWSGMLCRSQILNPFRFPAIAWGLVSHKFLRWMTPFFLMLLFVSNVVLAFQGRLVFLLVLQSCFYVAALIGWQRSRQRECGRIFGLPFAFCLANVGFFLGVMRSLRGQRIVAYK